MHRTLIMAHDPKQNPPPNQRENHAARTRRRNDAAGPPNSAECENQKIGRVDEADADGEGYETERSGAV